MSPETAMHWRLALEDPIFLRYLALGGGLLAVAAILLGIAGLVTKKPLTGEWAKFRGWCLIGPVVFLFVFGGRAATIVGVLLLACWGFKEFARATGLYEDWWMTGTVYVCIAATGTVALVADPRLGHWGWYGLFMALPVYAVAVILMVPIVRNKTRGQLQTLALGILGFVYLGWMFCHLGFLANSAHAYGYLLFLFFAVELGDVCAFAFGKLFGRTPMRSEISPNKTWGGAIGGFAVGMAMPWLLRFSFPHFGTAELLLTGLIVGVGGQLGDLTISVIKRDLGIKDMGAAIEGHGGILDRIDSLIFVAPFFFHMVRWFHDLY